MTMQTLAGEFRNLSSGHTDAETRAGRPAPAARTAQASAAPSLRSVFASPRVRAWVPPLLIASLQKR